MAMKKPGPLLAWFYRAPSALYRARLGWLMGGRFVMLTVVGRTSGIARRTVLEVVKRGAGSAPTAPPTLWVVASRGAKTDWYRNALAHPDVRVDWRSQRFAARAVDLDEDARVDLLADYQRHYPRAAAMLGKAALGEAFTSDPHDLRVLAQDLRALRLEPSEASTDVAGTR
ncbi:nitroreductase family deazaflavin-dependent oxidoreductase [Agromyces kandeliae]|uniref:Nitroreductase family deazaflavin-dependent oxidoreductase n=1 Tax=Agromyces kandeliae TaxID=2666141 RepID=A0A6L5QYD0_9MICO|nr:nitroreductase family deazaflavin-dependent oxidoreductase [Agromyces kandeliae]MRX42334.1 nitroreductase family deazaflavin-dependent oxidoreductase [Agromyces kandeliae]